MANLTVNQHYVWQHYLRAWASPKKIWCLRLADLRAFSTTPRNVGAERFFYEFEELTPDDILYIDHVISQASDEALRELNRGWVKTFQMTFDIRRRLKDTNIDADLRDKLELELGIIDKTLGEAFHGATESSAIPILKSLRDGDASFYDNAEICSTFIQFITLQYFRTAKRLNAVMAINVPVRHSVKRTWPIEVFIYATNVGASLFRDRKHYRINFLRNHSKVAFIAGDQPIINLTGHDVEDLTFFYPLAPDLAIIYTADAAFHMIEERNIGEIEAEHYNFKIYVNSDSQIFGVDPEYLKALAHLPKSSQF